MTITPPEICTVDSLQRSIPKERYDQVYWIRKMIANVVVESYPLPIVILLQMASS